MGTAVLGLRVLLAVVFATAGVGKLLDLAGSRQAMRDFGIRGRLADVFGTGLPIAELMTAAALVLRPSARWGAVAGLLLLLSFMAGIGRLLSLGLTTDCHCFGQIHSSPAGRGTLIRNGVLAAMAGVIVVYGNGPAIDTWVNARSAAVLVAVGLGAALIVLAAYTAPMQSRILTMRRELASAQRMALLAPPGIPVGEAAPRFTVKSLDGDEVSFDDLMGRGKPLLLTFVSPTCSSCHELFPRLSQWQKTLSERVTLAIVSNGNARANRPFVEEYGLSEVLLQEQAELLEGYRIRGTPSAVLVGTNGLVATPPAETVWGIEPMIRLALRDGAEAQLQSSPA